MNTALAARLAAAAECEIHTDALHCQMYATDASIYQMAPVAVAFPRTAVEAAQVIQAALAEDVPVTPRGAGTGLAGGAIGPGLILELSRHNKAIAEFNREARTVRVGAGVVLDQLNAFLKPYGLMFAPDVATSSRATLGGMVASNSSGARAPLYGTTIDHVRNIEFVLPDGRIVALRPDEDPFGGGGADIAALVDGEAARIREEFHDGICKRWPGYGLDRYLRARVAGHNDLSKLIGGSEGTLGGIFSAELALVPVPAEKSTAIVFFGSVEDAMQATVELLELEPAGIEHIDEVLLDQTRGQLQFKRARDLMRLDELPCGAVLLAEFYEHDKDKIAELEKMNLGLRTHVCRDDTEQTLVWELRKAGLSLLTGRKGPAKPIAGVEDVSVPPEKLPEYVRGLHSLMAPLGLQASYYGHAAAGLLHVRPIVDLHKAEDIARFRKLADGVSALAREFKGSFTAEHGVGMARTEYLEDQVSPELLGLMRRVKNLFDPANVMNPGKIIGDGTYRIDAHLRQGADSEIALPFEPVLRFAQKDESFVANLEQCNGCGGCRKSGPTMCPTFIATGDEVMSTRGRANVIRAVLEQRLDPDTPEVLSEEVEKAISNCLSCKACGTECPSNVNMALLKAELLFARFRRDGVPWRARLVSRVDLLNQLGSLTPGLANAALRNPLVRGLMEKTLGLSARRPLPAYAPERFDHWFKKRDGAARPRDEDQDQVILWDDCFVRHNEPEIGRAAVRVLEAAGLRVVLPEGHACCGRPAFSTGRLDVARDFGRRNLELLEDTRGPIVFLEASCYSMFKEDYRELGLPGAEALAARVFLFEQFLDEFLEAHPDALAFDGKPRRTAIHAHCHAKSVMDAQVMPRLAARIPGNEATLLDTGCCGMAGQFGALAEKYDLSVEVGRDLADKVAALAPETRLVASGTSCRHQIEHLTEARPLHMAGLFAEALAEAPVQAGAATWEAEE